MAAALAELDSVADAEKVQEVKKVLSGIETLGFPT